MEKRLPIVQELYFEILVIADGIARVDYEPSDSAVSKVSHTLGAVFLSKKNSFNP